MKDFPTGNNMPADFGERTRHREVKRLTGITLERTRSNANKLACYFTKFIGNMTGQVKIPNNLLNKNRPSASGDPFGQRDVLVGQKLPED